MMKSLKGGRPARPAVQSTTEKFSVDEVRLIADLRIMHSKVDELYQITRMLRSRHDERGVTTYADDRVLSEDIRKVDELYLWFVRLKEEIDRLRRVARSR
jgi:hypothetical protein